jgi:hypothetical protein
VHFSGKKSARRLDGLRGKGPKTKGQDITSEHRESIGYTPPKEAFPNGQTWVDSAVRPTY